MKLRNEVGEGEICQVDIFMVGFKASAEINRPFTCDIVGDFDVANFATLEILGDNVIRVNVSMLK